MMKRGGEESDSRTGVEDDQETGGTAFKKRVTGSISTSTNSSPARMLRSISATSTFSPSFNNPNPQTQSVPHMVLNGESSGDRIVLVMVGLPATGKTYIARRLKQYLRFFHGANVEVFNVGNYRRKKIGAKTPNTFFDPHNDESVKMRHELAKICMQDLKAWLTSGSSEKGKVAIFDATNTTKERRAWIMKELETYVESKRHVVFIESVCNDQTIVEHNVVATKLKMPDYENVQPELAVTDFRKRIQHYANAYEMLNEEDDEGKELSWIRLVDAGKSVTIHRIRGYLPGRIVQFLMNLHILTRPIYLSRHGQSEYNKLEKIGGDSSLTELGDEYAQELAKWVHVNVLGLNSDGSFKDPENRQCEHARLFTSSLKRTIETARYIQHPVCKDGWIAMRPRVWRNLDEIYAGVFDGMTYDEIKEVAPDQFLDRANDKLGYRYPRGESYLDVIERLDPIIHEMERQRDPLLLIGHQGILRIIYSYFMGYERDRAPFVSIPMNTVIKLTPQTYNCDEERFRLLPKGESKDSAAEYDPQSH